MLCPPSEAHSKGAFPSRRTAPLVQHGGNTADENPTMHACKRSQGCKISGFWSEFPAEFPVSGFWQNFRQKPKTCKKYEITEIPVNDYILIMKKKKISTATYSHAPWSDVPWKCTKCCLWCLEKCIVL